MQSPNAPVLPEVGLLKWRQIAPFLPIGRETRRKLVIAGKAPQPVRFSATVSAYYAAEVLRLNLFNRERRNDLSIGVELDGLSDCDARRHRAYPDSRVVA